MKNKGKQQRSRETISTILEAATQVIVEYGYEKATTNRIAERAGFSIGTLYQYFEDKEDVYRELILQELQAIIAVVAACRPQATLSATLRTVLSSAVEAVTKHPGELQTLSPLMVSRFRPHLDAAREEVVLHLTDILSTHRDEIVVPDLTLAARVVVAAAEGFAASTKATDFPSPEYEHQMHRMIFAYLTMPC